MNTRPHDDEDDLPPGERDVRTAALQATVTEVMRRPCARCGTALCGHAAVLAVVLGHRHTPCCPACIATEMNEPPQRLAERAWQWIVRRDCFRHVWHRASEQEGSLDADRPACVHAPTPPAAATDDTPRVSAVPRVAAADPVATYDAGDLGCGDLVLELRLRMRELPPGAVLHVIARDPAAPIDLPAWCGLVGHTLLRSEHPHYHLQRKRD